MKKYIIAILVCIALTASAYCFIKCQPHVVEPLPDPIHYNNIA